MSRQGTQQGRTPVKPSKKAQYGPGRPTTKPASRMGTNQRRGMTQGSRGMGTAGTADSTLLQRAAYVAPVGYDTSGLMNIIRTYLDNTGLEKNFSELLHFLLDRDELPYNPYPGFATRLRPHAEKFILDADTDDHIDHVTTMPLTETNLLNLYTVKETGNIWGLKSVLRAVNPQALQKYRWVVDDLTPKRESLFNLDGYSNQVMVALVGAAVFHGSFYLQCHIVQLRIEFLITGPEVAQGVAMFINSVMLDIDDMLENRTHILLGMNVPVDVGNDTWEQQFWEPERIHSEKAELLQYMSNAVAGSKYIVAECVFQVDPSQRSYMRGQKQYGLNFITVVEDSLKEEGLLSFAEFPMGALHEGVFFNRTHAEAYVNVYSPQTDYADLQNVKRASARPVRPTSKQVNDDTSMRRPAMIYDDDRTLVHRHVHARLELLKPTKIRIDGFRIGEDTGFGPFAWQITSPIKSNLQARITGFHPQAQLFDIVYHAVLLALMDRSSFEPELLRELYHLCHSTAGRLHMLAEQNKALRALIRGFSERDETQLIRSNLMRYRDNIDELFAHSVQERSNELIMVGRAMVAEVNRLLAPTDRDFSSMTHVDHIVATLRNIQNFSLPLMLELSEDCVHWCPQLQGLISKFHEIFPETVLRPQLRFKEPNKQVPGGRMDTAEDYKHGLEDDHIKNHEHFYTAPKIMAKESVLLKYVIDTHLDEVWHGFLVRLLADTHMPPNPYPRFLSLMRGCCMKMDLCYEKESALKERVMAATAQLVDPDNFIYQLPGCEAFGPETALAMVDAGAFVPVYQRIDEYLVNKHYIHRKGPYRVGICLGMVAPSTLFGKLMPYQHSIELHEHYYIQGPQGCEADARQLFGRMVQAHVAELVENGYFPIIGVVMGLEKVRWSWEDVINKRHGFWLELEMTCSRKEPIYMKAYIQLDGWRYMMVRKHFLLHFITDDSMENTCFFEHNPAMFYESLFFSKERAAFHFQNDGTPRGGNPTSGPNLRTVGQYLDTEILRARDEADWFLAYRFLLLKSLIARDAGDHAVEAWRLYHSVAGTAAYVASLCESLQDLTVLALEFGSFPTEVDDDGYYMDSAQDTQVNSAASRGDKPNSLDMEVLNKMTATFYLKAMSVVNARTPMLAWAMSNYVEGKLKAITERDPSNGDMFLAIEHDTIDTLEELKQIFLAVSTMISGDVYHVSPHAQAAIEATEKQGSSRPASVMSENLADPDQFRRSRPRATGHILDDDMLYSYTK
ncbi:hypothetical protein BaRGS_00025048 [Batillaria attramentaria]|uniref:Uncharacterized protein n=1 Tax=Batillaria attramentaria TaxID=370345 RepID=A0ABD0K9I2_9CAEN